MVDEKRIKNALDILVERGFVYWCAGRYMFTTPGRMYTTNLLNHAWVSTAIEDSYGRLSSLWVPVYNVEMKSKDWEWEFVLLSELTEDTFKRFCEVFKIDCPDSQKTWDDVEGDMIW